MNDPLTAYASAFLALGLYGALYLVQLLAADVVGIARRHTPGTPVSGDHGDLLFRATRAHANTTESVGAVILIAGFAIAVGGDALWVGRALWAILALRALHMLAYYADLRMARSGAFALGIVALLALLGIGLRAL